MKLSATALYKKLTEEYKIIGEKGCIKFQLKDLTVEVKAKDTVGNLLQEWLNTWMANNDIEFSLKSNPQSFPDVMLDSDDSMNGMLEIKSFDYQKSPNFDVANFMAFKRALLLTPNRLNSDYLIFGYKMNHGELEIADVWLKKIWEITGPSEDWPLKCQVKQGELVNIRPIKWYKSERTKFKPFGTPMAFVQAMQENLYKYAKTRYEPETPRFTKDVAQKYKTLTGQDLW